MNYLYTKEFGYKLFKIITDKVDICLSQEDKTKFEIINKNYYNFFDWFNNADRNDDFFINSDIENEYYHSSQLYKFKKKYLADTFDMVNFISDWKLKIKHGIMINTKSKFEAGVISRDYFNNLSNSEQKKILNEHYSIVENESELYHDIKTINPLLIFEIFIYFFFIYVDKYCNNTGLINKIELELNTYDISYNEKILFLNKIFKTYSKKINKLNLKKLNTIGLVDDLYETPNYSTIFSLKNNKFIETIVHEILTDTNDEYMDLVLFESENVKKLEQFKIQRIIEDNNTIIEEYIFYKYNSSDEVNFEKFSFFREIIKIEKYNKVLVFLRNKKKELQGNLKKIQNQQEKTEDTSEYHSEIFNDKLQEKIVFNVLKKVGVLDKNNKAITKGFQSPCYDIWSKLNTTEKDYLFKKSATFKNFITYLNNQFDAKIKSTTNLTNSNLHTDDVKKAIALYIKQTENSVPE